MRDRELRRPEVIDGLSVCADCAYCAANGTPESHEEDWPELWAAAVERESGWILVLDGVGDSDTWFSWSPCDYCRGRLGGDRFAAALIRRWTIVEIPV